MKTGIYGGSFNPIHRGHLTAAMSAAKQLGLDRLFLIPASVPPHKKLSADSATARQRLEMAVLATAEMDCKAEVLDIELKRTGKSYTSDTLRELREQYPEDEFWLLMGTDMFLSFHTWHEPEVILSLASVGAFSRTVEGEDEEFAAQERFLEQTYGARVATLENPDVIEISSTEVRAALPKGDGEEYLTAAVYGYILRRGLYGTKTDLKKLSMNELRCVALSYLKPKRMAHVLGTEEEAVRLARRYGVDETEARVAALLHDCTKKLGLEEQLQLCEQYGVQLDEMQAWALKLQHAITGAEVARDVFGVSDAVYEAIRWHTTGKADMTTLEKVIYLADYIEPTRDFPGVEELRKAVYEDLDRGLLLGLQMSVQEMENWGNPVHEDTLRARDFLAQQLR